MCRFSSTILPEDKAKIRRNAVAFQGFSTQSSTKFAEKMRMNPYVVRFYDNSLIACLILSKDSSLPKTSMSSVAPPGVTP